MSDSPKSTPPELPEWWPAATAPTPGTRCEPPSPWHRGSAVDRDSLRRELRSLTVPERMEVLAGVDLPRSVRLGGAGAIVERARQRGLLGEVERALAAWQAGLVALQQENER